jgi:hypothetical protein
MLDEQLQDDVDEFAVLGVEMRFDARYIYLRDTEFPHVLTMPRAGAGIRLPLIRLKYETVLRKERETSHVPHS